jgi:hypothetical protein
MVLKIEKYNPVFHSEKCFEKKKCLEKLFYKYKNGAIDSTEFNDALENIIHQ